MRTIQYLLLAIAVSLIQSNDFEGVHIQPLSNLMVYYINEKLNTTWRADVTKFHDWDMSAIKRLMGVPLSHIHLITEDLDVRVHENVEDLPDNFDSRDAWPDCPTLKEVRDQGNCGSCWAISAVETMSDRYELILGNMNFFLDSIFFVFRICISSKAATNKHLSTEDMVSCCHICGFG